MEATRSTDMNYQCNYATLGSLIQKHKISELCNQFYTKRHHRLQNAAIQPLSFHEAENYITQYRRNESDNKITPKYNEPHTSCTKTAEVLGLVIMLRSGRPGNRLRLQADILHSQDCLWHPPGDLPNRYSGLLFSDLKRPVNM